MALMERGDYNKANQIFETALDVEGIDSLFEKPEDPEFGKVFQPSNNDLATLVYNYVKANAVKNGLTSEIYLSGGM